MLEKIKWIICGTVILALIVLACLFFIPYKTTSMDLTLDMEIYPGRSVIEGTVPITLTGAWEQYLLHDDRLILTIDDFEHFYNIRPLNPVFGETSFGETTYISLTDKKTDHQHICFVASSTITGEDSVLLFVEFKNDLSGWRINPRPTFGVVSKEFETDPSFLYTYAFNWFPWE